MSNPRSDVLSDPDLKAILDRALTQVGGDRQSESAMIVREMMHTCLKLLKDESDLGELKLLGRSFKELRYALKVFRPYRHLPKISIFGSARTPETHPHYQAAVQFAKLISQQGWMVITGAGDGIMAAGHGGAGRQASFGVSIRLPFETNANQYIKDDPKLVTFRYFFTRKLMFMWQSQAVALFPGGFGTHDEGFEALTLVQTGKAPIVPIVMVDEPGGAYWYYWQDYVRDHLLHTNLISPEDLSLYHIFDDPQKAVDHVLEFYSTYHSQRFVRDTLVLRLKKPLSGPQVEALDGEFRELVAQGHITQGGPLPEETDHLGLPRLHFEFTKRSYGRLRQLIDRINQFGQQA